MKFKTEVVLTIWNSRSVRDGLSLKQDLLPLVEYLESKRHIPMGNGLYDQPSLTAALQEAVSWLTPELLQRYKNTPGGGPIEKLTEELIAEHGEYTEVELSGPTLPMIPLYGESGY